MRRVSILRVMGQVLVGCWTLAVIPAARGWEEPEIEVRTDIEYGTGASESLQLDIYSPKDLQQPVAAVFCIHGGGWAGGKRQDAADLAKRAAARGYVAIAPSYRLAPKHVFPAQIEDCKCAVRWVRAHAEELHVDTNRVGAIGLSAGAHLAMLLGTMDKDDGLEGEGGWADQSSKVQVVVSFVGPTNLQSELPEVSQQIVRNFIGGSATDKAEDYRRASPVTYVNQGDAPHLLFVGTKDPLVPYEQAFEMTTALDKAQVSGRVEFLLGAGHGWPGKELERTLDGTWEFLDIHLKASE